MRYLLLLLFSFSANASDNVLGHYQAVSESEWSLSIELKNKNIAVVEFSNWLAGKHNKKHVETHKGRWSKKGNSIVITYNGITEVVKYNKSLSMEEIGLAALAPGLKGQSKPTLKKSLIGLNKLWLTKKLKEIYK